MTEAKEATYVEAARRGEHRWWRYLLGLAIIVFSYVIGATFGATLVAFALEGREGIAAFGQADFSALGPVENFLVVMSVFPFFLAGIIIAVSLVHRRHPRTLITARERIRWRRVGQGFVAWFLSCCLVFGLGQYLLYPDTFSLDSELAAFALFVPLALVFTAIQTTTEELCFRGYLVQGASVVWANRAFLALVSAVTFGLLHLGNLEASGWLGVFLIYFVGTGLVWAVVSLVEGTTELAIGAHFANNIISILVIKIAGNVFPTPALFTVSEYHATFYALSMLVIVPLFLAISYGVFKRESSGPVSRSHRKGRR